MNKKLGLVLLIIAGLFLATLLSRSAALAWMTLPFLGILVAGVLTSPQDVRLSASRTVSHRRCEAGTLITMTVIIENNGGLIPRLQIHEPIGPKIHLICKLKEPFGALPANGKSELLYIFQAQRGQYHWENVQITVSDPFGLFDKTIQLMTEADILVLPERMSIDPPRLNPRHTLHAPGLHLSRQPGSGVDFYGVREYHPGDPLRWIHWRLSARHPNQLFSKEFEREEMADIGLILDGSAASNLKNGSEELFEYSIQAAAVLARSILRAGNRLSLLALGERVDRVFPGTGRYQLERILNKLAACHPGENVSLNTLKYLPVKLFPSHALIILVSPLHPGDLPAISRLLAGGYQVVVVSPDPVKFVSRGSHQPLAIRAAAVERAALIWRIRKIGARVMDWPISQQESIEYQRSSPNFQSELKLKHNQQRSPKSIDWTWFPSVLLVLLICGAVTGVLSGISAALMIALAALALIIWEYMEQVAFRPREDHHSAHHFSNSAHIRLLAATIGISLVLAEGGLLVQLSLPFGIIFLAAILILFSFYRFSRLMIR